MEFELKVWRQESREDEGRLVDFSDYAHDISPENSFLEMLDLINERLIADGERPIEFDSDCREGICGTCGIVINGQPHGPERETTVCSVYMRAFEDGQRLIVEPWRAEAFPVIRDLVVDRSAFDRIMEQGGYVSVPTGPKPDANSIKMSKRNSDKAFDAATCIGCGACVAACPNASASLFTGAKISQYALIPQGEPERERRVLDMVHQMDDEGFGNCSNIGECQAACPKDIDLENIARMRREYARAAFLRAGGEEE
jgi:succinate dehydrogenase / fumarate reductase iron-sulfur subunit